MRAPHKLRDVANAPRPGDDEAVPMVKARIGIPATPTKVLCIVRKFTHKEITLRRMSRARIEVGRGFTGCPQAPTGITDFCRFAIDRISYLKYHVHGLFW